MGAIKNYLINHPEVMELQVFDDGYRLRKIEEQMEQQQYEEELEFINTQLEEDAFSQVR